MTLIAAFDCDGLPIVIGDLVVAGLEDDEPVGVPSVGEASEVFPPGSGYAISRVTQKVVVFSPDLVLAWAGDMVAVIAVASRLKSHLDNGGQVGAQEFAPFLAMLAADFESAGFSCAAVGWMRENGQSFLVSYGATPFERPGIGRGLVAGSGSEAFASSFEANFPSAAEHDDADAAYVAISKVLSVIGVLLQLEVTTHHSLRRYFGGGYEIATLFEDGFRKVDDFTLLFFHAQVSQLELRHTQPHLVLKLAYHGDVLTIRTLISRGRELVDSVHAIRPLLDGPLTTMPPRPPIESPWLGSYVLVESEFEGRLVLVRVKYDHGTCPDFRLIPERRAMRIDRVIFEWLGQTLHERYRQHGLRWRVASVDTPAGDEPT